MVTKDVKQLLLKMNNHTTRSLEAAAGFCISRTHYEVSIEHLILKFLEEGNGDIPLILNHFNVDAGKIWEQLLNALEGFRTGNTGKPTFSPVLLQLLESAWIAISVHHGQYHIRSGAILEVLLEKESLQVGDYMETLEAINRDELRKNFIDIVNGSVEDVTAKAGVKPFEAAMPGKEGETALDLYTLDITGQARDGKIDPVFGRDKEIRQVIDILSRRRKNNPILVGEAGVGKTAIVEGLALRLANGDVPESLVEVEIRGLDLGLLQAGAGVKGEFENRLKMVINEVKEAPKPTIMFIDEAHTLIGAGGAAGTSDAANLLKPALARGELRTIAATTWSEYKKYIEKDPALERRFQLIKVEEPDEDVACVMLRGIKAKYESHHNIHISNEAIETTVQLADRYISGRQLPDKAVDLIDTAAARVKMGQTAKPSQLDDIERKLASLEIEIKAVIRDIDTGIYTDNNTLKELEKEIDSLKETHEKLNQRWLKEKELVDKITSIRKSLSGAKEKLRLAESKEDTNDEITQLNSDLLNTKKELLEIQGTDPLVHADVDGSIAAQIVSDWTGIPAGKMMRDEVDALLNFEKRLEKIVIGQEHAIREVADVIRSSKSGMRNPDAPIGVFLFVGPSGVGKTELARNVADVLFGGERFVITINMSEYQEKHTVSQLKGSPPGYVGYGEGGVLTEAVRQRPYSVVLLDEAEKAHPEVMNLFYQVFDRGFMRDGEGREIDFKNTIIMMTSNLGSDEIVESCSDGNRPSPDELTKAIWPNLIHHFKAALLARFKVIPFYPLNRDTMKDITKLKLAKISDRLMDKHSMSFEYNDDVISQIAGRCTQIETGARNIDFIIDRTILPDISKSIISKLVDEQMPETLRLSIDDNGDFQYTFS